MSADVLRRAAASMRERAEAATPGPWESDGLEGTLASPTGDVLHVQMWRETDAQHIASWHPAVALAVADWLEATAEGLMAFRGGGSLTAPEIAALAVARAYLGESV